MMRWSPAMLGVLALGVSGGTAAGQVRVENLSVSMGVATEMYGGNFSAVTVPQIDSTERALAGAGNMGARGTVIFMARPDRSFGATFDFGMRQFVTDGFQLRNYAPRELSGNVRGNYAQRIGGGTLVVVPTVASRYIADRPPMPLYLPPGYHSGVIDANYSRPLAPNIGIYGRVNAEVKNYAAPHVLKELDLLDRRSVTLETGARRVFSSRPGTRDQAGLSVFGAYLHHSYPKQGLGLLRTDNGLQLGSELNLDRRETNGFQLILQLSGTRSWSNASRVDYNAGRLRSIVTVELGAATQLDVDGLWAAKRYIDPPDRLLPGEEADNAAIVNARVTRFLGEGVRAGIGGGWTRAETHISGAYYQRFSVSFSLTVNPRW